LKNMTSASELLYNLFKQQKIWVYADKEFRNHLRYAAAEDKGKGFRIVKPRKANVHHTDAAVALAMAAYQAYKTHGFDVSQAIRVEVPYSEGSEWQPEDDALKDHEEANLPPQLRAGGLTEKEFDTYWDQYVRE